MSDSESGESRKKVIAEGEIPSGAKSAPFDLSTLSHKIENVDQQLSLKVGLNHNGEISILRSKHQSSSNTNSQTWSWIKFIQFASDCHVQNVRICRWQSEALVLQATKSISEGQELFLWFGEDVLVNDLGIPPYLSPTNIRGGKNYTCHKCGKEFEAPNPLKLHLALACGSQSIDVLWSRMGTIRTLTPSTLNLRIAPPSLTQYHPFTLVRTPPFLIPFSTGTSNLASPAPILHHPLILPLPSSQSIIHNNKIPKNPSSPGLVSKSLSEQQAQLESIMSNMGRGKNGHHVCVYCGKLYSRKYGLKIHIRTHTGFKPLQCKICNRPFGDPSNLNKHIRLHSDGNTPYRCDICGKVLVRRRDLDRHIRSRHSAISLPTQQQTAIDCSIRHLPIIPTHISENNTITFNDTN